MTNSSSPVRYPLKSTATKASSATRRDGHAGPAERGWRGAREPQRGRVASPPDERHVHAQEPALGRELDRLARSGAAGERADPADLEEIQIGRHEEAREAQPRDAHPGAGHLSDCGASARTSVRRLSEESAPA